MTSAATPNPCPPGLPEVAAAAARCPRMACREQGVTQTGSQELSTAARLATGPLAALAPLVLFDDDEEETEAWEEAALVESLLELELDGLLLSKELENFHWGILGMSIQKVVVASCSPSMQGESARAAAPTEEEEDLALGSRGGNGGRGRLCAEEDTTGVATTLLLMAKLCIRSSEEVTDSLRKRSYFGLRSMPGGAA